MKRQRILMSVAALLLGAAPACSGPNPAYRADQSLPPDAPAEAGAADVSLPVDQLVDRPGPEPDLAGPDLPGETSEDLGPIDVAEPDSGPGDVVDASAGEGDQQQDLASQEVVTAPPDTLVVVDTSPPPDAAASTRRGLVGHWPLDEGSGGVARDETSLGNDGQLRPGTTWTQPGFPARFANPACLSFDGVDSEVQVSAADLPDIGAPKTISVWAYFPAPLPTTAVRKNLVALSRPVDGTGIQFGFDAGRASIWLRGEPGALIVSSVLPERTWYNLVYVFDGTLHQLYINGALVGGSDRAKHTGVATSLLFGSWGGSTQHFPGLMDDIRFYDRALSAAEIAVLADGR